MFAQTLPRRAILLPRGFRLSQYVSSNKEEGKAIFSIQKQTMINDEQYIQSKLSETVVQYFSHWPVGNISALEVPLEYISKPTQKKEAKQLSPERRAWGNITAQKVHVGAIFQPRQNQQTRHGYILAPPSFLP